MLTDEQNSAQSLKSESASISAADARSCAAALILSTGELSGQAKERIAEFDKLGVDWSRVLSISEERLSLPVVYRTLSENFPEVLRVQQTALLKPKVLAFHQWSLRLASAQSRFHEECILPVGCPHVYFKGPSLAVSFYRDLGEKVSRDIDVLVPKGVLGAVVDQAIKKGYRAYHDAQTSTPISGKRDLVALAALSSVVSLVSADGVHLEVHTDVDKGVGLFSTDFVLANSREIEFGGARCRVMHPSLLLNFVCYHGTRHTWSHLNWFTDLDAIVSSARVDLEQSRSLADRIGMRCMLEACLEMRNLVKSGSCYPNQQPAERSLGAELVELCLANLGGTPETEWILRRSGGIVGLPRAEFVDPPQRPRVVARRVLRRLSPDFEQYLFLPLPKRLHWIYFLTKALRGTRSMFRRQKLPAVRFRS